MKLEDLTETEDPISGARGGLFDLDSWAESTGGWIKWLGSGMIGVAVVTHIVRAFGGSTGTGLVGALTGLLRSLTGGGAASPAASAGGGAASASPQTQAAEFYV